jgi:hypothetical protein
VFLSLKFRLFLSIFLSFKVEYETKMEALKDENAVLHEEIKLMDKKTTRILEALSIKEEETEKISKHLV